MSDVNAYTVGQQVMFGRDLGEKTLGEVVKVNRTRLKVKQLENRGTFKAYAIGTVWTVPPSLCSSPGAAPPAPAPAAPARSSDELMTAIRRIYSSLEPEHLSCDGELPMSVVRRRAAALRRELTACFRELGRTVTEVEAFRA